MRVRIVGTPKGTVDGVEFNLFHPGVTYDLPASLAHVLIVEGWAEPDLSEQPGREIETKPRPLIDLCNYRLQFNL